MTTATFYPALDGFVEMVDATYANVTAGTGTADTDDNNTWNIVGQFLFGGNYFNYEAFLSFDTSSLPDDAIVQTATLSLFGDGADDSDTDFTIEAYAHDFGASIAADDYQTETDVDSLARVATFDTSGWNAAAYNDFTSDSTFRTSVSKTGTTRIVLVSSRFGTAPSGNEDVTFYSAEQTGTDNDPKLVVTYVLGGEQTSPGTGNLSGYPAQFPGRSFGSRRRKKLTIPEVVHEVQSDGGSYGWRATERWEATETAPGGYDAAFDVLPARAVRRNRHIFAQGSNLRTWNADTGELIWAGELRDSPSISTGRGEVEADGHARMLERRHDHLLYQTRDYDKWFTHLAEHSNETFESYTDVHPGYEAEVGKGYVKFHKNQGVTGIGEAAVVMRVPRSERGRDDPANSYLRTPITRIAFKLHTDGTDSDYDLKIYVHDGDRTGSGDGFTVAATYNLEALTQSLTVDAVDLTVEPASAVGIGYLSDGASVGAGFHGIHIFDLRVNGIAAGDTYGADAVAHDIATRMGLETFAIEADGFNVLPLFLDNGSWGEVMDYVDMLTDRRTLILETEGGRRYMDRARWDREVWVVEGREQQFLTDPEPRYDRLTVTYRATDGTLDQIRCVHEAPLPTPQDFGRVRLPGAFRNEDTARAGGMRILDQLRRRRRSGSARLTQVLDNRGELVSAMAMHAGSVVWHPEKKARVRVARTSKTLRGSGLEFDHTYAPLDRLRARWAKRGER